MVKTLLNFTDIICISGISFISGDYSFEVILDSGVHRFFSYQSQKQACTSRNDIIERMAEYWGRDQLLIPNGVENEVAINLAISDITEIFLKDSHAGFTVMVSDAFVPLNFVFNDIDMAESYYNNIFNSVEAARREKANTVN
ncbi:hypothetical protein JCM12296A_52540 [Desulfosarcina cetonica]|uniref:hypothetical protein n=1 Tax=Desulfosarcina cetonica TaxID=90730 RepID=UPI0006D134CE|nr:hypothetical protein [Desulfosarcina cetonica]